MRNPGQFFSMSFRIPLTIACTILVGALLLLLAYYLFPDFRPHVQFFSLVVGGSAAIYSAYYVGYNIRMGVEKDRINKSFDLLNSLNNADFVDYRMKIEKIVMNHTQKSPEELYKYICSCEQHEKSTRYILGVLEDMSIGIRVGYSDENIVTFPISEFSMFSCGFLVHPL